MRKVFLFLLLSGFPKVYAAESNFSISFLPIRGQRLALPEEEISKHLIAAFDLAAYRNVRVQPIYKVSGKPDHLLVYLHSKTKHRVDFASIAVDSSYAFKSIQRDYRLTQTDHDQQVEARAALVCPDETVEFISIAPNDDDFEQGIAQDVGEAAIAANLKTVILLGADATRRNYLNYMSCPKLRGNFYDGDADTQVIVTSDGEISYQDFNTKFKGTFNHNVTNIWLACEAYNHPMLPAVATVAQSRKYAAGINDLEVGPSDDAAACAMKEAILGKPMTAAFNSCYKTYDNSDDKWGFSGDGSDLFWD